MRLPERLRVPLKSTLTEIFGDAPVYLFGSRADDTKKGGDIDLAVRTEMAKDEFRSKKVQFTARVMMKDWDVGIDLVQLADRTDALLKDEIKATGILLS